jgi:hypothetical protein
MRKHTYSDQVDTAANAQLATDAPSANGGLPNRLMTAFEVAEFVGCHEETVRRAYLRGLLVSQRFGVRGRSFTRRTSSTGSGEARRPESRDQRPNGRDVWPSDDVAGDRVERGVDASTICGSTRSTAGFGIECR